MLVYSTNEEKRYFSAFVAWAHNYHIDTTATSTISPNSLLYYGSIDVGMQEFLPVMFHSLFLTNNQKFIAPHDVGFVF